MKLSRRDFMKFGGVTLITVVAGSVLRAVDQGLFSTGKGIAYEPWQNWQTATTVSERIVAAGILASNPHNSQPWLFQITENSIDLFADTTRQIGVIDPFLREMYIGLGCAIENMMLAAQAEGLAVTLQLIPNPTNATHVAHLDLQPASASDVSDLYQAIPNRHTNRGAYDLNHAINSETYNSIEQLVTESNLKLFWFKEESDRQQFAKVALDSAIALTEDEQQSIDSHQWWRHDWDELQATADGLTLDAQALGFPITPIAKFLPDLSRPQNDVAFVNNVRDVMLPTATAFGIIALPDEMNHVLHLECGMAWQRIHLWATTQGLAMQPLSQMCERVDRETELNSEPIITNAVQKLINDNAWYAIMPFRMGYPTVAVSPSPRRGLEKVIR